MNHLYIAFALLAVAFIVSLIHYLRTKDDGLPMKEHMIDIPEGMIILDEASGVTPEMFRKPKQMKSRPRRKL